MASGTLPEDDAILLREGEDWYSREEVAEFEGISERAVTDRVASGYYRSIKDGRRRKIAFSVADAGRLPRDSGTEARSYSGRTLEVAGRLPEDIPELAGSIPEVFLEVNDKLEASKERILELREENFKLKTLLDFSEIRLKEKDELITELRDRVSQDKEHIQAEKSRADMASNQLMNANALIKRRDDAPAQITEPNPEIELLKEKIKKLEKAKTPWWKKLSP